MKGLTAKGPMVKGLTVNELILKTQSRNKQCLREKTISRLFSIIEHRKGERKR